MQARKFLDGCLIRMDKIGASQKETIDENIKGKAD